MAKLDHLKLDRRFKLIDPLTGQSSGATLEWLSRSLRPNRILAEVQGDGSLEHLGVITTWDLVYFARTWAGWVNPEPINYLARLFDLVDRWLDDPSSVAMADLMAVADAAEKAVEASARDLEYAVWSGSRAAIWSARAATWGVAQIPNGVADASRQAAETAAWANLNAARDTTHQHQGEMVLETLRSR